MSLFTIIMAVCAFGMMLGVTKFGGDLDMEGGVSEFVTSLPPLVFHRRCYPNPLSSLGFLSSALLMRCLPWRALPHPQLEAALSVDTPLVPRL